MLSQDSQLRIAQLRIFARERKLTTEENREVVKILREARLSGSPVPPADGEAKPKRTSTAKKAVDIDALDDELRNL